MTEETAAKYIKNQLKFSNENEKMEELTRKPNAWSIFYQDLERPSVIKKSPWCGYVAQV
jgi:hypothetical protein